MILLRYCSHLRNRVGFVVVVWSSVIQVGGPCFIFLGSFSRFLFCLLMLGLWILWMGVGLLVGRFMRFGVVRQLVCYFCEGFFNRQAPLSPCAAFPIDVSSL